MRFLDRQAKTRGERKGADAFFAMGGGLARRGRGWDPKKKIRNKSSKTVRESEAARMEFVVTAWPDRFERKAAH